MNGSYTISITVPHSAQDVYHAVSDPRRWWSQGITGSTVELGDEFIYTFAEVHYCRLRVVEARFPERVAWEVVENRFDFVEDQTEWVGTRITFDIESVPNGTVLTFTHVGLLPEFECFDACSQGWTHYAGESLKRLITTGSGLPNAPGTAHTDFERELGVGTD